MHLQVSFQTVSQAVESAITSRAKVEAEIQLMKQLKHPLANDQFVPVMQASHSLSSLSSLSDSLVAFHISSLGLGRDTEGDDSLCGERSTLCVQLLWGVI